MILKLKKDPYVFISPSACFCRNCGHGISFWNGDIVKCRTCGFVTSIKDFDKIYLPDQGASIRWAYDERNSYEVELDSYLNSTVLE